MANKQTISLRTLQEFKKQIFIILTLLFALICANHWLQNMGLRHNQTERRNILHVKDIQQRT